MILHSMYMLDDGQNPVAKVERGLKLKNLATQFYGQATSWLPPPLPPSVDHKEVVAPREADQ